MTTAATDTAKSCTVSKTTARRSWPRMRAGCSTTSGSTRAMSSATRWARASRRSSPLPILHACAASCSAASASTWCAASPAPGRSPALEAASIDEVTNPTARTFRAFAEQTKSDLKALAACIRSARAPITRRGARHAALPGAGRRRREGCHRRLGDRACRPDPRCVRRRVAGARSHEGGGRQGLQGRGAELPRGASLSR